MSFIIKLLISAVAVFLTAKLLPGIVVTGFGVAIIVAIVLALLNTFLKPLLVLFTIPITVFTLGLFLLVINGLVIMLAGWMLDEFLVKSIWWAIAFSLINSFLNTLLSSLIQDEKN